MTGTTLTSRIQHFTREQLEAIDQVLKLLDSEDSVFRCHTSFECVEACPKNIPLTEGIQSLKRSITKYKLKKLLRLERD